MSLVFTPVHLLYKICARDYYYCKKTITSSCPNIFIQMLNIHLKSSLFPNYAHQIPKKVYVSVLSISVDGTSIYNHAKTETCKYSPYYVHPTFRNYTFKIAFPSVTGSQILIDKKTHRRTIMTMLTNFQFTSGKR